MVDIYLDFKKFFTSKGCQIIMESCSTGDAQEICWFCRKGRHEDCMKEIPTDGRSDGPHDCTFDTKLIPCKCQHRTVTGS